MILCPARIKYVQGVIYDIMSCTYKICTGWYIILCPAYIKYVQGVICNIMSCMCKIYTGYNIWYYVLHV